MSQESPPPPQSSRPLTDQGEAAENLPVSSDDDSTIIALHRPVAAPDEVGSPASRQAAPVPLHFFATCDFLVKKVL